MKVLHILNHFLPQQTAGTEVYTWALCKQLQQSGVEVEVMIPNYGDHLSVFYEYDGLNVTKFAEPSVVDRSLIMGFRKPDGLQTFKQFLQQTKPRVVHFHELAGSNGITIHHVQAAKESGAAVLMTFHLATNTCKTGTLVQEGKHLCEGKIDLRKCSRCFLQSRGFEGIAPVLVPLSVGIHNTGINVSAWGNRLGTALGTASLIGKTKKDFDLLISHCDRVVSLTNWYKSVLLLNGVPEEKITVVAQGLPTAVSSLPLQEKEIAKPIKLLFLGRINPFKGLHLLIEAIQMLPQTAIRLDIYGNSDDINYENYWKKQTTDYRNINWKGKLKQSEVVSVMKQYDALCLCSTFSEMSPLVIQEARAAGIPVIASGVYGNAEQIEHGKTGLLFEFNNIKSLRDQLQQCVSNPSILAQMRQHITKPRSFTDVAKEYYMIYKQIGKSE